MKNYKLCKELENPPQKKLLPTEKKIGNFNEIEDLKNVPGIGDAKFDAIKDKISVK